MAFISIFLTVVLVLNFIIGTYGFYYAWKTIRPIREADEKRDAQFPPYRRTDIKNWSAVKFYLGAVTVMPFRFAIGLGVVLFLFVFVK
jgi:hypothetical protein